MTELNPSFAIKTTLDAIRDSDQSSPQQADQLDKLFLYLLSNYTDTFLIPFNSIFAQLSFAISQLKIFPAEAYALHYYRIHFLQHKEMVEKKVEIDQIRMRLGAIKILADAIHPALFETGSEDRAYVLSLVRNQQVHDEFIPSVRFAIQLIEADCATFYGMDEDRPEKEISVRIDKITQENLLKNLEYSLSFFTLPVMVSLIGVRVRDGEYYPESVICLPDFLIDVTAVAMCYGYNYQLSGLHFLSKFSPKTYSDAILKGQIANYFLDELINHRDLDYDAMIKGVFKLNPLYFAMRSDKEVKDILIEMRSHFQNLVNTLQTHFPEQNIETGNSLIEPSFYGVNYGLQGRLDMYAIGERQKTIVELKSGKVFMPNTYGINHSHYVQTLLYNLLVNPLKEKVFEFRAFLLYSGDAAHSLRYVPVTASQQYEAVLVRNNLATIEYRLSRITADGVDENSVFSILDELYQADLKGFVQRDLEAFRSGYMRLNSLEQKYLRAMVGFIAREYLLAKPGQVRDQYTQGQASLWINSYSEKDEHFGVLGFLIFEHVDDQDRAILTFKKSERTNALADFRSGDVVLVYVTDDAGSFVWAGSQVFKATLIHNNTEYVSIRLRNPQANQSLFQTALWWNIEKDVIDTSFNNQFKSLGMFALSSVEKRQLILGQRKPITKKYNSSFRLDHLDPYLRNIIEPAVNCQDYYLIWGPPGTGKTSLAARNIIEQLALYIDSPLLVVAYTNRAVDELCEVIEELGDLAGQYLRIGSRYSTDERFRSKLLDVAISEMNNRKTILDFIRSRKIVCGTLSSILGKEEIFGLLHFEYVLVDEASQILDPQMIHLISRVNRFILIGDHNQLPAVVTQSPEQTKVSDPEMNAAGIFDLRYSLFERLYKNAIKQGWTNAYGLLSRQGRMHQEIMTFPTACFYDGQLSTVLPRQQAVLPFMTMTGTGTSGYLRALQRKRSMFINVDPSTATFSKMNDAEAVKICEILTDLKKLYHESGSDIKKYSIGIITPFRAQIININQHLAREHNDLDILVDTVERFQGGARDIILLSMVVSNPAQIRMISETQGDGIDRKLNVAITRAREQLIMVGSKSILSLSQYYRLFIEANEVVGNS